MSEHKLRVVVFSCGDLGGEVATALTHTPNVEVVALVTAPYARKQLTNFQKLTNTWKKEGAGAVTKAITSRLLPRADARERIAQAPQSSLPSGLKHLHFAKLHSPECIDAVRCLKPDLGVVAGTYILKPELFSIPRLGSINMHTGKVPEYRGAAPVFWEMFNGETEVGITIHEVEAAVDTGRVYLQRTFPLDPAPPQDPLMYIDNYRTEILRRNSIAMVCEVVAEIAAGTAKPTPQNKVVGNTYRSPDYPAIKELRRRVRARCNEPVLWKRHVKAVLGRLIYGLRMHRMFLGNKGLVVLFHRIDDRLGGNPISATSREFDEFCAFFTRYFRVVSLQEMLQLIESGADLTGVCCITFDDGYLDNLTIAASTLKRYSLPACFFVASGMIGSKVRPWWDAAIPIQTIWMQPNDLRELASGFEIGAHTIHHVDLGQVKGEDAHKEIAGSRTQLEQMIGSEVRYFTYPYGGPQHITEENLQAIRETGYRCCMSAFGGAVAPKTDLFRIKRAPISPWYIDPYQFGFEAFFFET